MEKPPSSRRGLFIFISLSLICFIVGSRIPMGYFSEANPSSIQIWIQYRGAFEEEIERTITVPLENALGQIPGLEEISSVSERERCRIHLVFTEETNRDDAYIEVREVVDRLYPTFPPTVQRPVLIQSNPTDPPAFVASFPLSLGISVEELKRRYESVEGVGEVEVGGSIKDEIIIRWKADVGGIAQAFPSTLASTVNGWNVSGAFNTEGSTPSVVNHLLVSPDTVSRVPLNSSMQIEDFAEVTVQKVTPDSRSRVQGEEFLILYIRPSGEGSPIKLSETLREITGSIPQARILYDQGEQMKNLLRSFALSHGLGILLSGAITGVFLTLSIPFSLLVTLSVLTLVGESIDLLILSAITVGAGMGVHFSILVQSKDLPNPRLPIILSALCIAGIFLPFSFAPLSIQRSMTPLALIVQLGAILGYLFFFLPVFLLRIEKTSASPRSLRGSIPIILPSRKTALCILIALSIAAVWLVTQLPIREEHQEDPLALEFILEFDSGISLDQALASTTSLEQSLNRHPALSQVYVKYEQERATFSVELHEAAKRAEIVSFLEERSMEIPHSSLFIPDNHRGGSSVPIVLSGQETSVLQETAIRLAKAIQETMPASLAPDIEGVVFHFKEPLPSKQVSINPLTSQTLGIRPSWVRDQLHLSLSSPVIDKGIFPTGELDIRITLLQSPMEGRLLSFPLFTAAGKRITLADLATLQEEKRIQRIYRANRRRSTSFSVLTTKPDLGPLIQHIQFISQSYPFPPGATVEVGKEWQKRQEHVTQIFRLLLFCMLFLGLLLGVYYEEARRPLLILLYLALSLPLPLWGLWVLKIPLGVASIVGLFFLCGLVVSTGVIVFHPNQGPRAMLSLHLRSILMATLTPVVSVLPLIFRACASPLPFRLDPFVGLTLTMSLGAIGSLLALGCLIVVLDSSCQG